MDIVVICNSGENWNEFLKTQQIILIKWRQFVLNLRIAL